MAFTDYPFSHRNFALDFSNYRFALSHFVITH